MRLCIGRYEKENFDLNAGIGKLVFAVFLEFDKNRVVCFLVCGGVTSAYSNIILYRLAYDNVSNTMIHISKAM